LDGLQTGMDIFLKAKIFFRESNHRP